MTAFTVPLAALAERMKADLDTVVRKSTYELFRSVVLRSPVDTGRFRANWNASFGSVDASTSASVDQGRGQAEAAKALAFPVGGVAYLSNGLPYAVRLEYGYSKQAPAGMVKLTAAEFAAHVQRAIGETA